MRHLLSILMVTLILILSACNNAEDNSQTEVGDSYPIEEAIEASSSADEVEVPLMNSDGVKVATATLTEKELGRGVQIKLEGDKLPPGEYAFHIHDVRQCTPPDFITAGSHYNPTGSMHGFNHPEGPHAGDLENITVDKDGLISVELEAPMVTLQPEGENTLFTEDGTSLVIHEHPDDYISQPAGDAGNRIGCGIIER